MAIRYGANALGLVSEMPSGPGPIAEDRIKEISRAIPPGVSRFLLTSKTDAKGIIDQQKKLGVDTIQLVDRVDNSVYAALRESLPGVQIVQVIHVTGADALDVAGAVAPQVDALLLDSGNPSARELGGTGRLHDWLVSRKIREAVDIPVFLAGGLNPKNVAEAVQRVAPYGIDVCSGLRMGIRLDERLVSAFFESIARN
jgi:phosphoribosylanthranilate isomerase